jgi:GTPase SAR1 family protein
MITFIVGLPASGKTTYMNKIATDELLFDDIKDYKEILKVIDTKNCIVTDPFLCNEDKRIKVEQLFKGHQQRWIYFENNKEQCLTNAESRPQKPVRLTIEFLAKIYKPPAAENLLPVFCP